MALNGQFFESIRASIYKPDGLVLSQNAVDSCNAICTVFDAFKGERCMDDLAAILATVVIETGPRMVLSIEEIGKGAGKAYGKPAGPYGLVYYGRGPCEVTWLANYQKAKLRTGVDFVRHPELMCDPHYGVVYMIDGMYGGVFTGKGLRTYITPNRVTQHESFRQSRRIINGLDRSEEYADLCMNFSAALRVGYEQPTSQATAASKLPALPTTAQVTPPSQQPMRRGLIWEIGRLFGKG